MIWLQNVGSHNTIKLPVADRTLPRRKRSAGGGPMPWHGAGGWGGWGGGGRLSLLI